jgi:hypothetical protein
MRHEDWAAMAREIRLAMGNSRAALDAELQQREPAFTAQMDAAVADPAHDRAAASLSRAGFTHEVPAWPERTIDRVNGLILRAVAGLSDGTTLHCPHVALDRPAACVLMAWANALDCYACLSRRAAQDCPELTEREQYTCDACRHYEPGQPLQEGYLRSGPFTVYVGLCAGCSGEDDAS